MKRLILGEPRTKGFRPSLEFLQEYITVTVKSGQGTPQSAKKRPSPLERVSALHDAKKKPIYSKMDADDPFHDIPTGPNMRKLIIARVHGWSKSLQESDEEVLATLTTRKRPRTPPPNTNPSNNGATAAVQDETGNEADSDDAKISKKQRKSNS